MKLVFMGTSAFALPTLKALHHAGHEILAVLTQPDRPSGRGLRMAESPVKRWSREMGWHLEQPEALSETEIQKIESLAPEMIVVVSYGLKLPSRLLKVPPKGSLNLHPSLLPKYRGAAPINWALINGESETGISVIEMAPRMDAGDIVLQEPVPIYPEENAGELEARLSELGAELMVRAIALVAQGRAVPVPQDEALATLAPKIKPEHGRIDWSLSSVRIANLIRGLTPRPGAYTIFRGRRLSITKVRLMPETQPPADSRPGSIVGGERSLGPLVRTGDGVVALIGVKPESRREMSGEEFLRGYRISWGEDMK